MKSSVRARALLGCLQRVTAADAGLSDGQLLGRYISARDDAAFAALVRRHGPMVLAVCRRVLRHAQDAEDAFQATFVVLARKAASLRDREAVGGWLHGVACRAAWAARSAARRRNGKEQQGKDMAQAAEPPKEDRRELLELLDRELARLPEKYRLPVVLCELEGRGRREAALQLGLPEGTLSSRLARARGLLASRLGRRGLAVSGAALAALLTREAGAACVPGPLMVSTVRAAGGSATAAAAALAQGVMKAMLLTKLTGAAWGLLLTAALGVGAVVVTYQAARAQPRPTPPATAAGERDDLEALRLEVEALRRGLQATRERVRALEEELRAQKQQGPGAVTPGEPSRRDPGAVRTRETQTPGAAPAPEKPATVEPPPGPAPTPVPTAPAGAAPAAPGPTVAVPTPPEPVFVFTTTPERGQVAAIVRAPGGEGPAKEDPTAEVEAAARRLREKPTDPQAQAQFESAVRKMSEWARGRQPKPSSAPPGS